MERNELMKLFCKQDSRFKMFAFMINLYFFNMARLTVFVACSGLEQANAFLLPFVLLGLNRDS